MIIIIKIAITIVIIIIKIIVRNNIYLEYWSYETHCIHNSIKTAKASMHLVVDT